MKNIISRDFELDENDDIKIISGDFKISIDSGQDHADSLLNSYKGEWKMNPLLGIGIKRFLNAKNNSLQIKKEVKEGLELDGFDVSDLRVEFLEDELKIFTNATRKK